LRFTEIPRTTKLFNDFLYDYSKVARFYTDYGRTVQPLAEHARRVGAQEFDRKRVPDALERINRRVGAMFENGVMEEVRAAGVTSATASQMIGFSEIRELLAGKISLPHCIAEIQQATRRYAKRQLTWFRRQSNFSPLNLSFLTHNEAVKWISLRMLSEVGTRDD